MSKNSLKAFLNVENYNVAGIELDKKQMELIERLFSVALEGRFVLYFEGRVVMEPYDGLEFKTEEEEFYYNNGNSKLVFQDINDFKVRFKINNLKKYDYELVYKVVEKAVEFNKKHPEVVLFDHY